MATTQEIIQTAAANLAAGQRPDPGRPPTVKHYPHHILTTEGAKPPAEALLAGQPPLELPADPSAADVAAVLIALGLAVQEA